MSADRAVMLSWISAEVDQALKCVRDGIARFSSEGGEATALAECPAQLHQVCGALRMVGLAGATKLCEAIERSFAAAIQAPEGATLHTIDRAVAALKDFVGELARGQPNSAAKLYPAYRELVHDASEKDLFFPDLATPTPPHDEPLSATPAELPMVLQNQRTRFQRGMLALLRNQPVSGLEEMRQALGALHRLQAQLPEPRGLWWAAQALIDGLVHLRDAAPDQEWVAQAKAACNKIDFQMRDLAGGSGKVSEQLLRDVLWLLARCKPATPLIAEVQRRFGLDALVAPAGSGDPGAPRPDTDALEPVLRDLRVRIDTLKSAWLQYLGGEPKSAVRFREQVGAFKEQAERLGSRSFSRLLDAISLVAAKLPDPYPAKKQLMVIEMASAFLLAESMVDTFTSPPSDMEEQAAIMGGWLLDAVQGKSAGEPPAGLRGDLSQQISALQLRAQVAREVLANLQQIEQVLDAFAREAGRRDTLQALESQLRQIHGALTMLGMTRAAEVLTICETMVAVLAAADHPNAAEDMDWIAEGLSSLGFYLAPCVNGREPAEHAMDLFYRRYERRDAPASMDATMVMPSALQAAPQPAAPEPAPARAARPGLNEELVAIYLDEATEVLAAIDAAVPACRAQPDDREALTTIRRGFHTLKGSGRMVGLMDLGEVAWELEQVMNRWLEEKRAASPALLELVAAASSAFAGWIAQLRAGTLAAQVAAEPILRLARALASAEDKVPQEEPGTELRDIYAAEAAQHVATLQREYDAWRAAPGQPASHEFMRAAHTLASSSHTAGFDEIGRLADLLERWMPLAPKAAGADCDVVHAAILRLCEMVGAVAARQDPRPAEEAAGRMLELMERLRAPALPIETPASAQAPQPAPEPQAPQPAPEPQAPQQAPGAQAQPQPPKEEPAPAPSAPAPSGRELRRMHDDIDGQLLPIFLEEAQALLPQIGSDLRDWKANPGDERISQSLRRGLHTLKGSARMAGAIRLGELTHIMEGRIEGALEKSEFPAELFAELEEKMDRVSLDVERMGGPVPALAAAPTPQPVPTAEERAPVRAPAAPRAEPPLPSPAAMMRVNAETLDQLITEAGEVSIARSRVEAELRGVRQALSDLGESIGRLRTQLREVEVQADSQMQSRMSVMEERRGEFDPLEFDRYTRLQELTRMMAEGLHDIASIQQALMKHVGESDSALLEQARISRDVQQELMRMRAVPFSNLNERLYRIARQTARELDKKAELDIQGAHVELDRSVLERLGAPLEHMLRNAIAHGIELPAVRLAAGKAEAGRISIALRQEANEIALVFSDDGVGIDLAKLHRKALERGLVQPGAELSEADLAQLIFVSGLSTADAVSQLAGRGVGMDVVRNDIAAIGGRVEIATTRGKGTTFTVYLPLTLAVTQAVLVRAGPMLVAISSAMVEQVLRLKADQMTAAYDTRSIALQDRKYPLHYFQHLLGTVGPIDVQTYNSVLLLRSGIQRIAVHVDELIGNQEIVVKNIGPQLARVPGIAGATVLADGSIVLLMNPVPLASRARQALAREQLELVATSTRVVRVLQDKVVQDKAQPDAAPPRPAETRPADPLGTTAALSLTAPAAPVVFAAPSQSLSQVVMVVDDSLTVRKITCRLLEREGYTVLTAKDGVDALEQLKETLPGVMLVDIEMPRMDGFDLTKTVRGDSRTAAIPIIMITSRTADKHRNQALQLGVNAFLGKPYQEAELLQRVASYLGEQSVPQ